MGLLETLNLGFRKKRLYYLRSEKKTVGHLHSYSAADLGLFYSNAKNRVSHDKTQHHENMSV